MLDKIQNHLIREFTTCSLKRYGRNEEATSKAEKTAEVVYGILEERGLIQEHAAQTFVDVILSAALLHDLFEPAKGADAGFTWIFEVRNTLPDVAKEIDMPQQLQDGIYDAIEAQLGEKTPVAACRPKPGTPQEMFAYAVWFTKNYLV